MSVGSKNLLSKWIRLKMRPLRDIARSKEELFQLRFSRPQQTGHTRTFGDQSATSPYSP